MAKSRYSDTEVIDDHHYASFRTPVLSQGYVDLDLLKNVKTVDHTYMVGDRLDKLAARYWNEESYWWVIALVNNVSYPFASGGLTPGRIIKIPVDVREIFDQLFK